MLNSIIKLDLHIHSIASKYKEKSGIVDNSTKENTHILLNKLKENEINLFSITDHNRFDCELYNKLFSDLDRDEYQSLHLLCGVEFDVQLESGNRAVHIVTIFDAKNSDDRKSIHDAIESNKLEKATDSYDKNQYEALLKEIGLNVLLIVHQKSSLDNKAGKHKSLSEGVEDPYKIIKIGYVNALEFQKPGVEGIIKNNLKNFNVAIPLITGSDCHDWEVYPFHDKKKKTNDFYPIEAKMLPTFKGLHLALTSPSTRFNRRSYLGRNYIESFEINNNKIPLDPGINVIIGENGSGKSTLLGLLSKKEESYMKKIQADNNIKVKHNNDVDLVKQSQIINEYREGKLLKDDDYYDDVDDSEFKNAYTTFSNTLKEIVKKSIAGKKVVDHLKTEFFIIDLDKEEEDTYYINVLGTVNTDGTNPHSARRKELEKVINSLLSEYNNNYYEKTEKLSLKHAIRNVYDVYKKIKYKEDKFDIEKKIKNIIDSEIEDYSTRINEMSSSKDKEIQTYKANKEYFVSLIINACNKKQKDEFNVKIPQKINGESTNYKYGFKFTKQSKYSGLDVTDDFFETMFTKDYSSVESVKSIQSVKCLTEAVRGTSKQDEDELYKIWDNNLDKFFLKETAKTTFIHDDNLNENIGNTLGELSLAYYKFQIKHSEDKCILMIDQPEDNISNKKISENLVNYFQNIRENKQLIIVTHNPLLVVNLDADNVIYLKKTNKNIEVKSGCLESEDQDILNLVSDTLDGGKEMIEKRLKIYG